MKNRFAYFSILVVVISCFIVNNQFKNWKNESAVILGEVKRYYGFLPAKYIYKDLKIDKSEYFYTPGNSWFEQTVYPNGKKDFGKTYGFALMYSPFFFAADFCATYFHLPDNGFSEPYRYFLLLGTIFYLLIALDFIRKILKKLNINEWVIGITILLLGLGTNVLIYATYLAPSPYIPELFLTSLFVYFTICWHEEKKRWYLVPVLLSFSILTVIDFSDAFIVLFFILYGTKDILEFSEKKINPGIILSALVFMFLIWMPQFQFWKLTTDSYLGLKDHSRQYFFMNPKFFSVFFSFNKGWLIYTPLMIFSILGIRSMWKTFTFLRWSVVLSVVFCLYLLASSCCLEQDSAFSQPFMIKSYALLAIPLSLMIKKITESSLVIQGLLIIAILFFSGLNVFQIYQYHTESLLHTNMTSSIYFKQFGKIEPYFESEILNSKLDSLESNIINANY